MKEDDCYSRIDKFLEDAKKRVREDIAGNRQIKTKNVRFSTENTWNDEQKS